MSVEIELSIMDTTTNQIRPLLDQFEAETGIRVRVRLMDWDTAWNELVRAALYKDGPDLSEIGTSWTGDMIGMNALRPFQPAEVMRFGRPEAFIPVAWRYATGADGLTWAIPWLCGSRLIFYRKEWLDRAGLDPTSAFRSPDEMDHSLTRLAACGCRLPWLAPLAGSHENLHHLATWVWAEGGTFLRPDHHAISLLDPAGMRGMQAYFALSRFFPPEVYNLASTQTQELFASSPDAAVVMSGQWMETILQTALGEAYEREIGVAVPPGPSFVGGSNLVVWKYSHQAEAAIQLVHFLTGKAAQLAYSQRAGLMPARAEVLEEPPFSIKPFFLVSAETLMTGRSFPAIPLWGLVEGRLMGGVNTVWTALHNNPREELLPLLTRTFEPIRKRLDLLLEGK